MSTIIVTQRSPRAKAKQLRKAGIAPGSIFGASLPQSISIQMDTVAAVKMLRGKNIGSEATLELDGKKMPVLIKEISRNALTNELVHLEFQALDANTKINTVAHINLLNREKMPGYVNQSLFTIPYCALPADITDTITIDLTTLKVGASLSVGELDIAKNENIELLIPADTVVLNIADLKRGGEAASEDSAE